MCMQVTEGARSEFSRICLYEGALTLAMALAMVSIQLVHLLSMHVPTNIRPSLAAAIGLQALTGPCWLATER